MFIFFFFSSRRRHTRLQGDWSSDVCSSDLSCGRAGAAIRPDRKPSKSGSFQEIGRASCGKSVDLGGRRIIKKKKNKKKRKKKKKNKKTNPKKQNKNNKKT